MSVLATCVGELSQRRSQAPRLGRLTSPTPSAAVSVTSSKVAKVAKVLSASKLAVHVGDVQDVALGDEVARGRERRGDEEEGEGELHGSAERALVKILVVESRSVRGCQGGLPSRCPRETTSRCESGERSKGVRRREREAGLESGGRWERETEVREAGKRQGRCLTTPGTTPGPPPWQRAHQSHEIRMSISGVLIQCVQPPCSQCSGSDSALYQLRAPWGLAARGTPSVGPPSGRNLQRKRVIFS